MKSANPTAHVAARLIFLAGFELGLARAIISHVFMGRASALYEMRVFFVSTYLRCSFFI